MPDAVVSFAWVYAALRDDVVNGTCTAPNFDYAARLSQLVDDLLASAADERTTTPTSDWP